MKYLSTSLLTLALLLLPASTFAQSVEFRVVDSDKVSQQSTMIPIDEYVLQDIERFSTYVTQSDLSNEELSEAISDLTQVLEVYLKSLQR